MPWTELIDAILWVVALAASLSLGYAVYRRSPRRDLSARLFLGMVAALTVLQVQRFLETVARLYVHLAPGAGSERLVNLLYGAWPLNIAALVAFGCLTLHLCLAFPIKSRLLAGWQWSPLLFYLPGLVLAVMVLAYWGTSTDQPLAFWGFDWASPNSDAPQLLFVAATLGGAVIRLFVVYLSRADPAIRRRLTWILGGLAIAWAIFMLGDVLPSLLDLPRPVVLVPGLQQLPILILLAAFALAMLRYQALDVEIVVKRSVVYSALAVAITLLYLLVAGVLSSIVPRLSPDAFELRVAVFTTLIVVLIVLPLRDGIQRAVDRLFLRSRPSYPKLLQEYSRILTTPITLPRLLDSLADQIEAAFHPSGLAIVLANDGTAPSGGMQQVDGAAFRVVLSRGQLAASLVWREQASFDRRHLLPAQLAARRRPLYLPQHLDAVPAAQKPEWEELERSGGHLFVPMHLHGQVTGWLAVGPRRADLPYTRQDLDFASALIDQSCVALENARLYDAVQKRAGELAMVAAVSSALSSSLDLEYVLQTIVESAIQVVGCDKSAIFELDEEGRDLSLRMAKGLSQAYIEGSMHLRVGQDARAMAATTRQPMVVPDIEQEPKLAGLLPLARQEGYRGMIDLPLIGRRAQVGILTVYFAGIHHPSPTELEVLTTFASQAAIAIENARLYAAVSRERDRARRLYEQTDAALARRVEELTAIEEISRRLTGTVDLRRVVDLVLERALQTTQVERGMIALYEREQRSLRLLTLSGFPPEAQRYESEPWSEEWGIIGRVARTGVVALVPDVTQDPDYSLMAPDTCSELSVPIVHNQNVMGVITLESDRPSAFTPEHVRFVELLAEHAAIGINNARLFRQVMDAHDRLQAVLNSTGDAVIVLDTTGQVILANPRVRELFGLAAEEWLWLNNPQDVSRVLASGLPQAMGVDMENLAEMIGQVRDQADQAVDIAFSFQDDGRRRYVEGTISPVLSLLRQVIGRVAVLRDVTRQHELEQFREDLTGMLIHNLQGPLAAIISSLEILRDDYQLDSAEPGDLVRIALSSGRKLLGRIESLLKLRQLEERQVPLDLQAISLADVVGPVVEEYRPVAIAANVTLGVNLAPDLPAVIIDEEIVGRLFGNLLDNALKYTPAGGQIEVRAVCEPDQNCEASRLRSIPIAKHPDCEASRPKGVGRREWAEGSGPKGVDGRWALCAVTDTGPGIDEESQEVIFEKFHRGARPTLGRRSGMGIGLHYCRLAVEAHGGRIWVESQVGQGSAFYFTLPVAAGKAG
jgi:NtrC-family two-component system sensor histidine kinase KinB